MKVEASLERLSSAGMSAIRASPGLDLRVVRRHQLVARRRDEGAADLAALLGADGMLQVGLVRRQPPTRGRGQRPSVCTRWAADRRRSAARRDRSTSTGRPAATPEFSSGSRCPCSARSSRIPRGGRTMRWSGSWCCWKVPILPNRTAESLRAADIDRGRSATLFIFVDPAPRPPGSRRRVTASGG